MFRVEPIDLNGLEYTLILAKFENQPGYLAQIADEAFQVVSETTFLRTPEEIVILVEKFSGMPVTDHVGRLLGFGYV